MTNKLTIEVTEAEWYIIEYALKVYFGALTVNIAYTNPKAVKTLLDRLQGGNPNPEKDVA